MEWVLVLILLQNYPAKVDLVYKGGYTTLVGCFEEREVLVEHMKLKGPQAVCISVEVPEE